MGIFENIQMAFAAIRANRMRSLLTMLGIIIGIGSVIAIQTVGNSLTGSLTGELSSLGVNDIMVSVVTRTRKEGETALPNGVLLRRFSKGAIREEDLITDEMLEDYRRAFPEELAAVKISEDIGLVRMTSEVKASEKVSAQLTGVNLDAQHAAELKLVSGRWLTQEDIDGTRMLTVVADRFVKDAFGLTSEEALGRTFHINLLGEDGKAKKKLTLTIVGVYTYKPPSIFFGDFSSDVVTQMYLPVTTGKKVTGGDKGYDSITVVPSASVDAMDFAKISGDYLASFYSRNPSCTIRAMSYASQMDAFNRMMDTTKMGISAIAAIALLVGGIGVMNIMTVSVTERTKEIGTRKALGAPASAIRLQFIIEAMTLCLVGGVIGIAVGLGLGSVGAALLKSHAAPSVSSIVIAVVFSMGIGVFFGYYPASKAAKMNPIDALRYE